MTPDRLQEIENALHDKSIPGSWSIHMIDELIAAVKARDDRLFRLKEFCEALMIEFQE